MEGFNEYNAHFYECQLNRGRKMAVIAGDDNHNHYPTDSPKNDSFGGITYILADKLDYNSIITAMERQDFYATEGPQIFSLILDGGVLKVKTSPARRICFVTNCHKRAVFYAGQGQVISSGEFTLHEKVEWVYLEVTDQSGKRAYSRAYFREELQE